MIPVAVNPYIDEALPDLFFRAAVENFYPSLSPMFKVIQPDSPAQITRLDVFRLGVDAADVAHFLGVRDVIEIRDRMARPPDETRVDFFGTSVRATHILGRTRRVAPMSLRSAVYQRASWMLRPFSFDPITKEKLLDRCPRCDYPLSFQYHVSIARCGRCSPPNGRTPVDLRDYPQETITTSDPDALDFVCSLVDRRMQRQLEVHDALRDATKGELFELAMILATKLGNIDVALQTHGTRKRLATYYTLAPDDIAAAGRIILDWPDSFVEFAHKLVARMPRRYEVSMMFEGNNALGPLRRQVVDMCRQARASQLNKLLLRGSPINVRHTRFLSDPTAIRSELERTAHLARNDPTIIAIADRVGTTTLDLAFFEDIRPYLGLSSIAIEAWPGSSFGRGAQRGEVPAQALPAATACFCLSMETFRPWRALLAAFEEWGIKYWIKPDDGKPLLNRLFLEDYERLRALLRSLDRAPANAESISLARSELCAITQSQRRSVGDLIEHGLLPEFPTALEVKAFRSRFISPSEAAFRIRMTGNPCVKNWVARNLVDERIPIYRGKRVVFYDRRKFEALYQDQLFPIGD